MKIIIILFILLITMSNYIDNVEHFLIKSQFLRNHKQNIIQILMNNQ